MGGDREFNKGDYGPPPTLSGVPGLTESAFVEYIRPELTKHPFGKGYRIEVEEFDWNKSFSPVIEQLRRTKEEELKEQKQKEAAESGKDVDDVMTNAEIARQVNAEIADMFDDVTALYNKMDQYRDRLSIITSELPDEFKNIEGVAGADSYFLVKTSDRAEGQEDIFNDLKRLNVGNIKVRSMFSHLGGLIEGHDNNNFFGWNVTVDGHRFVFVWDSPQKNNEVDEEDGLGVSDEPQELDDAVGSGSEAVGVKTHQVNKVVGGQIGKPRETL